MRMSENDDAKLARLLESYEVEDATPAFLERILAAAPPPRLVLPFWPPSLREALAFAAAFLLCFYLGQATSPSSVAFSYAGSSLSIESVVFGAQNMNEVIL